MDCPSRHTKLYWFIIRIENSISWIEKEFSALIPLVGPDGQVKRGGELNLWPFLLFSFAIILLFKIDRLLYLFYVLAIKQSIKQG